VERALLSGDLSGASLKPISPIIFFLKPQNKKGLSQFPV